MVTVPSFVSPVSSYEGGHYSFNGVVPLIYLSRGLKPIERALEIRVGRESFSVLPRDFDLGSPSSYVTEEQRNIGNVQPNYSPLSALFRKAREDAWKRVPSIRDWLKQKSQQRRKLVA